MTTYNNVMKNGLLLTIEGIDGSGKTTLAHNLYAHLTALGYPTILTREPGATDFGKQIRAIVQSQAGTIAPESEYLLFAADRAHHFKEIVIPALTSGKIVISDRMADSSVVYQGYGRGLDKEMITTINRWTMQGITPDITIYVQVSPETAMHRITARNEKMTAFEQEKQLFIEKLISGFNILFKNQPHVIEIDGEGDQYNVLQQTIDKVMQWIQR